jgi:hypothetical protein
MNAIEEFSLSWHKLSIEENLELSQTYRSVAVQHSFGISTLGLVGA